MTVTSESRCIILAVVAFAATPSAFAQAEPLHPVISAVCVEPIASVTDSISRKRASESTDCDPAVALRNAKRQAEVNARDAIAPKCRAKITLQEAQAACRSRGLRLVPLTSSAALAEGRPAAGRPPVDATLPIPVGSQRANLCAILRNLPNETQTSTAQAGILNGGCVLNNGRVTTKRVRVRATCGVTCAAE